MDFSRFFLVLIIFTSSINIAFCREGRLEFDLDIDGSSSSITLKEEGRASFSLSISKSPTLEDFKEGLRNVSWNATGIAAVLVIRHDKGSIIAIFVKNNNQWIAYDISEVEDGNFGKLGKKRSDYLAFETKVTKWIPRNDDMLQVGIQTSTKDSMGKTFSVEELLIVDKNFGPIFR